MRPEQAGPEGDEIVEQECSAFWRIQAMDAAANRNQILNMVVVDGKVVFGPWGPCALH